MNVITYKILFLHLYTEISCIYYVNLCQTWFYIHSHKSKQQLLIFPQLLVSDQYRTKVFDRNEESRLRIHNQILLIPWRSGKDFWRIIFSGGRKKDWLRIYIWKYKSQKLSSKYILLASDIFHFMYIFWVSLLPFLHSYCNVNVYILAASVISCSR